MPEEAVRVVSAVLADRADTVDLVAQVGIRQIGFRRSRLDVDVDVDVRQIVARQGLPLTGFGLLSRFWCRVHVSSLTRPPPQG